MITYRAVQVRELNWEELTQELGKDGWYPVSILQLENDQFFLVFAKRRTDKPIEFRFFEIPAPDLPRNVWLDDAYWKLSGFLCGIYKVDEEYRYVFYAKIEEE